MTGILFSLFSWLRARQMLGKMAGILLVLELELDCGVWALEPKYTLGFRFPESHSRGLSSEFEFEGRSDGVQKCVPRISRLVLLYFAPSDGVKPTIVVTAVVPIRKILGSGFSISIRTGNR